MEFDEDGFEKSVSCEELLLATLDVISRLFSRKAVIKTFTTQNWIHLALGSMMTLCSRCV